MELISENSKHYLRKGSELLWQRQHLIVTDNDEENVTLACPHTGVTRTASIGFLDREFQIQRLVPRFGSGVDPAVIRAIEEHSAINTCSEAAQTRLLELKSWMNALRSISVATLTPSPILQLQMSDLLANYSPKLTPVSMWTLYKNEKRLRAAGGKLTALIPKYHHRGKQVGSVSDVATRQVTEVLSSRLDPAVVEIMRVAIEKLAESETKVRPFKVLEGIRDSIQAINAENNGSSLSVPSQMTVTRWLNRRFTAYELAVRKYGKDLAAQMYRQTGARIQAERILQCVQYDDIDTRVFLIDEDTGRAWGTAYMTFGVDEYSRAVVACQFGAEHRSVESALATFFQGVRRKDMSGPEFALCKGAWSMRGRPGLALLDNASYNAAKSFHLTLMSIGADYQFSRPHTPTDKSAVEFFNGQFKRNFVDGLPGAAIQKSDRDASARGEKTASLTASQFCQMAHEWNLDYYLPSRQGSGRSPQEIWDEQAESVDLNPPDPGLEEFLKYSVVDSLKLRRSGGLQRNMLRYQNDNLEDLQRRMGPSSSLNVRVNLKALAGIYVHDPLAKEWFHVPCIEDENYVRGLTETQHKLVVKNARESKKLGRQKPEGWSSTRKDDLYERGTKLCKSNKLTERGQGYRFKQAFKPTSVSPEPPIVPRVVKPTSKRSSSQAAPRVGAMGNEPYWPDIPATPTPPAQIKMNDDFEIMMGFQK